MTVGALLGPATCGWGDSDSGPPPRRLLAHGHIGALICKFSEPVVTTGDRSSPPIRARGGHGRSEEPDAGGDGLSADAYAREAHRWQGRTGRTEGRPLHRSALPRLPTAS